MVSSFLHSFGGYLLSNYCVPGPDPSAGDATMTLTKCLLSESEASRHPRGARNLLGFCVS